MGTKMAPAYANIFMGRLEGQLLKSVAVRPFSWLRFIYDIEVVARPRDFRTEFLCVSVLRVASRPRVKLAGCKSALTPLPPRPPAPGGQLSLPVVSSTDRSKAMVPVLVLLFVALWFILRGDLLYVFPCVILFLCFSVLLVLRLPRLGKRANLSAFRTFVRFVLVWICRFPLPLGVWERLRFVIVAFPGLFSYLVLTAFLDEANNFHPSIKFTAEISTKQHVFLDTQSSLLGDTISAVLYTKPTDTHLSSISYSKVATRNTAVNMFLTALYFASDVSAPIRTPLNQEQES